MDAKPQESRARFENVGWTIGNECPFRCNQCYSMSSRVRGRNLTKEDIDRIISQLAINSIKTVNLGGNEPLYTNGINPKHTMLPYIISSLVYQGIVTGLTTAGITINYLAKHHSRTVALLNDVDVSFDSPFPDEHNTNRGANLYEHALLAIKQCQEMGIEHTIVMCGMAWNLSERHLNTLVQLARATGSNVRINFIKPTEEKHIGLMPSPEQFYQTASLLFEMCRPAELGEPLLSVISTGTGNGCPCGIKSFRINSISPDGKVSVSPCVYMHDFRTGNLLVDSLYDIVNSKEFNAFRLRHDNPHLIPGCADCGYVQQCRGGCAARAYYTQQFGYRTLFTKDPYCFRDIKKGEFSPLNENVRISESDVGTNKILVHRDYLCTLILEPK